MPTNNKQWRLSHILGSKLDKSNFQRHEQNCVTCYQHINLQNLISKEVLQEIVFDEVYEFVRHDLCKN